MYKAKNKIKVNMQIYKNYHYAKLSGIPVVSGGMVKLTPKNFKKLNHPQKYIN